MAAEISYRESVSPVHAIAVAERLADEHKEGALYRNLEDGTIEVGVMQKGVLTRNVVDDRGVTLSVESSPPSRKYTSGKVLTVAGLLLFAVLFVYTGFSSGEKMSVWSLVIFFLIFPTAFAGSLLFQAGKLQARLDDDEWKPVPVLGGWEPRTWEQLEAVETLVEENENRVLVRHHDPRAIEVAAMKGARFSWYRVDESGETTLLEAAGRKYAPHVASDPLRKHLRKRGLDAADWTEVSRRQLNDEPGD